MAQAILAKCLAKSWIRHQVLINYSVWYVASVRVTLNGCRRKTEIKFGFSVRHSRSSMWGMTGNTGWESSRATFSWLLRTLCQAPHSRLIFRGEVGFELRQDTTWSCQRARQNRDGAVSFESACLGSQAMVFIVFRVGAIAESRGTISKYWLRTPRSSWDFLRMYSSVDVEKA